MPRYTLQHYRPMELGFTDEQEKALLAQEALEEKKLDEILEYLRKQDQIRTLATFATIAGFLFTMTQFGELIAVIRRRKKPATT